MKPAGADRVRELNGDMTGKRGARETNGVSFQLDEKTARLELPSYQNAP